RFRWLAIPAWQAHRPGRASARAWKQPRRRPPRCTPLRSSQGSQPEQISDLTGHRRPHRDSIRTLGAISARGVAHAPDRVGTVVAHPQRPAFEDRDAARPAPTLPARSDKAGEEILVLAGGASILQRHPDHFVTRPNRSIPRAMFRGEDVPAVFRWELLT